MHLFSWLFARGQRPFVETVPKILSPELPGPLPAAINSREAAESAVESALRDGRIEDVIQIYKAFEKQRTTFHPEVPLIPSSNDEILTALAAAPTALRAYPTAEIREARIQAAMVLLGMKRMPRFTPEMKPVNTLIVYAQLHGNLEAWRRGGVVAGVFVQCSNDGPCRNCKKLEGRVWPIGAVPEFPNPACANPAGCRCALVPQLPD
jgi:hypothetical protein